MSQLRNIRHERFIREVFKANGNATEAYRRVYPNVEPKNSARAAAARLLASDSIKRRFWEVHRDMVKRSDITVDKILTDYQRAMDKADALDKPGDVTNAATAQAKLVGLLIDRREIGNAGEYDSMTSVEAILQRVSETEGPEVARAMARAFGVELQAETSEAKPTEPEPSELLEANPPTDTVN